jgi:micrococcal nuclease
VSGPPTKPPTPTTTSTPVTTTAPAPTTTPTAPATTTANCAASYHDVCIPPPPDLDCNDIPYRNFRVVYNVPNPDPHRFDGDHDGVGCES